ncbi:MAG: putative toxin-antitoxin system toxin component, PIN family [Fibromonadales bacterium]|nr:putative toxin-antitoxin system toxin component, PIN family [Fibromonadales bacterium]
MPEKKNKTKQLIKVVVDTNILVSSQICAKGCPSEIVTLIRVNKLQPYYNAEIMNEYNRVLRYPRLQIASREISVIVNLILRKGVAMETEKSAIEMTDESDRKFYDLHKAANAILITGNIRHFPKENTIMKPADFMFFFENSAK